MAHVRKDTLVAPVEWAKHLRRYGKMLMARLERLAAKKHIKEELNQE